MASVLGYQPEQLVDVLGEDIAHPDDLRSIAEQRHRLRTVPGARERLMCDCGSRGAAGGCS